jgi:hypothetical protein
MPLTHDNDYVDYVNVEVHTTVAHPGVAKGMWTNISFSFSSTFCVEYLEEMHNVVCSAGKHLLTLSPQTCSIRKSKME